MWSYFEYIWHHQDCSIPTAGWFGTCVLSTEILTWTALLWFSASALMVQWQNTCMWCMGVRVQILVVMFTAFSLWHPWEPRFKSGFHNSFWDYVVPDRIPWMTLELYRWNLGTCFGLFFSGIHKSKIICSVPHVSEPEQMVTLHISYSKIVLLVK